jgi:hypothetical protein
VRQRVARLRRFFRERWAAQVAALGLLALLLAAGIAWWRNVLLRPDIVPERADRAPRKLDEARELRERALERCRERAFEDCLRGLDKARALDPIGDDAETIQNARAAARDALSPEPTEPEPAPPPSASAEPAPSPSSKPERSWAPRPAPTDYQPPPDPTDYQPPPRSPPRRTRATSEEPTPKPPPEERGGQK